MKKLLIILTSGLFWLTAPMAKAMDCSQIKSIPSVEFSTSYGKLRYDKSKNNLEITNIAKQYGIKEKGLFAAGLATINVNFEVSVNTLGKIYGPKNICVVPTNINIYIGFSDPVIYLSKNLRPGSCKYNVILRHEQTHQQINAAALRYFLPKLKESIVAIIKNTPAIEIKNKRDGDRATQDLIKAYMRQMEPLVDYFKKELLREQKKLDNHKNYQMEGDLCRRFHEEHD